MILTSISPTATATTTVTVTDIRQQLDQIEDYGCTQQQARYPLDSKTIHRLSNYCSKYSDSGYENKQLAYNLMSTTSLSNNRQANNSRSTLVTFECDHLYLDHSDHHNQLMSSYSDDIRFLVDDNDYSDNISSEELESLAAEWLEISRTLAENDNLVNEMIMDFAAKELMQLDSSNILNDTQTDSSFSDCGNNILLCSADSSVGLLNGASSSLSCSSSTNASVLCVAPSNNSRARRSYSSVSASASASSFRGCSGLFASASSTSSSISSYSSASSSYFNTSISSFETGESSVSFTSTEQSNLEHRSNNNSFFVQQYGCISNNTEVQRGERYNGGTNLPLKRTKTFNGAKLSTPPGMSNSNNNNNHNHSNCHYYYWDRNNRCNATQHLLLLPNNHINNNKSNHNNLVSKKVGKDIEQKTQKFDEISTSKLGIKTDFSKLQKLESQEQDLKQPDLKQPDLQQPDLQETESQVPDLQNPDSQVPELVPQASPFDPGTEVNIEFQNIYQYNKFPVMSTQTESKSDGFTDLISSINSHQTIINHSTIENDIISTAGYWETTLWHSQPQPQPSSEPNPLLVVDSIISYNNNNNNNNFGCCLVVDSNDDDDEHLDEHNDEKLLLLLCKLWSKNCLMMMMRMVKLTTRIIDAANISATNANSATVAENLTAAETILVKLISITTTNRVFKKSGRRRRSDSTESEDYSGRIEQVLSLHPQLRASISLDSVYAASFFSIFFLFFFFNYQPQPQSTPPPPPHPSTTTDSDSIPTQHNLDGRRLMIITTTTTATTATTTTTTKIITLVETFKQRWRRIFCKIITNRRKILRRERRASIITDSVPLISSSSCYCYCLIKLLTVSKSNPNISTTTITTATTEFASTDSTLRSGCLISGCCCGCWHLCLIASVLLCYCCCYTNNGLHDGGDDDGGGGGGNTTKIQQYQTRITKESNAKANAKAIIINKNCSINTDATTTRTAHLLWQTESETKTVRRKVKQNRKIIVVAAELYSLQFLNCKSTRRKRRSRITVAHYNRITTKTTTKVIITKKTDSLLLLLRKRSGRFRTRFWRRRRRTNRINRRRRRRSRKSSTFVCLYYCCCCCVDSGLFCCRSHHHQCYSSSSSSSQTFQTQTSPFVALIVQYYNNRIEEKVDQKKFSSRNQNEKKKNHYHPILVLIVHPTLQPQTECFNKSTFQQLTLTFVSDNNFQTPELSAIITNYNCNSYFSPYSPLNHHFVFVCLHILFLCCCCCDTSEDPSGPCPNVDRHSSSSSSIQQFYNNVNSCQQNCESLDQHLSLTSYAYINRRSRPLRYRHHRYRLRGSKVFRNFSRRTFVGKILKRHQDDVTRLFLHILIDDNGGGDQCSNADDDYEPINNFEKSSRTVATAADNKTETVFSISSQSRTPTSVNIQSLVVSQHPQPSSSQSNAIFDITRSHPITIESNQTSLSLSLLRLLFQKNFGTTSSLTRPYHCDPLNNSTILEFNLSSNWDSYYYYYYLRTLRLILLSNYFDNNIPPAPSIALYRRHHQQLLLSAPSNSVSTTNNNSRDYGSQPNQHHHNDHYRNHRRSRCRDILKLHSSNSLSTKKSSTLKSSSAIFTRLRALTQLLLMSHTLKEALDDFSDSSNLAISATAAVPTSATVPFPIDQIKDPSSSFTSESPSFSQANPSSSAPQSYSWNPDNRDNDDISTPTASELDSNLKCTDEKLDEMETTDNRPSTHLELQQQDDSTDEKCDLKSPSRSPSPPTTPSHGSRSGLRSVSHNNSKKSTSDPPMITRSSSSAASANPTAEYLAHHRPSCPNASIQFLDKLRQLDESRQSIAPITDQLSLPKVSTMAHPSSTPSLSTTSTSSSPIPPQLSNVPDPPPPAKPCNLRRPNSFARLSSSFNSSVKGQHYLKYPTKKVRGPYAEMLESMMRPSGQFNSDCQSDEFADINRRPNQRLQTISFTDELLRQTKKQRNVCENYSKEGFGTNERGHNLDQIGANQSGNDQNTGTSADVQENDAAIQLIYDMNLVSPTSDNKPVSSEQPDTVILKEELFADQTLPVLSPDEQKPPLQQQQPLQTPSPEVASSVEDLPNSNNSAGQSSDSDRSITAAIGRHLDTRAHIVGELYDTEKTYCDVLRTLFETYLVRYIGPNAEHPATASASSNVIKWLELIGQLMPAVIEIHSKFLEQLRRRIADWSPDQTKIANLFDCFENRPLVDFYLAMIDHLNDIRAILKHHNQVGNPKDGASVKGNAAAVAAANQARSLETPQTTAQRRKFTLDDLLISVIQRIPRYKLLLTRLLKYTIEDHEDYSALTQALNKIHNLLLNIGTNQNGQPGSEMATKSESFNESSAPGSVWYSGAQTVDTSLRQLYVRDLEAVIEGAQTLLDQYPPTALVHIYEYVMIRKRERAIFVLDDCIVLCQNKSKKKSDKFEYNKFKVLQIINMDNVVLRCQCWQHRYPGANGPNQSSSQTSDSPTFSTSLGCVSCIETLEYDLKSLLKMQTNVQSIYTVLIRNVLEATLTEQLQTVYNQLVEMHETIARCSKDNNVDLYILNESDRELTNSDLISHTTVTTSCSGNVGSSSTASNGAVSSSCTTNISGSSTCTNTAATTTSQHHSSSINPKPVRIVHYKCPQHQPNSLSGEPELSINFSCVKKRLEFETIVTNLRALIVKSRLKLEFLCALPYQKTRAGLQFTCVSPTIGTNDVWICKSDGFVGQISVLSINNLEEPTVISCNGVCNAQIVCLSAVPSADNLKLFTGSKNDCLVSPSDPPPLHVKPLTLSSSNSSASSSSSSLLNTLNNRNTGQHQQQQSRNLRANKSSSYQHHTGDSIEETDASENECDTVQHRQSKSSESNAHHHHHHQHSPSKTTTLLHHLKPKSSKCKTGQNMPPPPPLPAVSPVSHSGSMGSNGTGWNPGTVVQLAVPAISMASISVENILGGDQTASTSSIAGAESNNSDQSQASIASISPDCPTMWFGTDDSTIYIYSCYDAVRIGKNKAKVVLSAKVESIQYFKERVFVGLANRSVAVFTRDSVTGFWQTTPTIIENIHCSRFCVVNQDFLWTTSLNVVQIRNEDLQKLDEPIHVDELDEISFIIANQFSVFLTSQNSSYIYRYSPIAPYQRLGTISTGPFVDKALTMSEDIIRHHKNACLKISAMHQAQDRIWIGTSAGVILILDNKNTIEIIPNGHTGHVRFITSIKLMDGKVVVISGGDGYEQFSPGTGSNIAGPTDLFHFMSYCSNLALNLLGRSSSNSNVTATLNNSCANSNSASTTTGSGYCGGVSSSSLATTSAGLASSMGIGINNSVSGSSTSSKYGTATSPMGNAGNIATSGSGLASGTGSTESDNDITPTSSESATLSRNISRFTINCGSEDSKSHLLLWKL